VVIARVTSSSGWGKKPCSSRATKSRSASRTRAGHDSNCATLPSSLWLKRFCDLLKSLLSRSENNLLKILHFVRLKSRRQFVNPAAVRPASNNAAALGSGVTIADVVKFVPITSFPLESKTPRYSNPC
jgi:hypothetical protein